MLSNALTEWIKVNIILDLYVSVHNAFWLFVSVTYKQKKIERLGLSNDYGYINKPCWPAFFLLVIRLRFTVFSATNTLSITNSMMNGCIGHHQSLFMLVFTPQFEFSDSSFFTSQIQTSQPTFTCQTLEQWKNCVYITVFLLKFINVTFIFCMKSILWLHFGLC